MKVATILSLASLALGSVIEKRECAGNNCNRAVTGTRAGLLPLESRSADCSSFMAVTVTPTPRTVTVTSFVPPEETGGPGCNYPEKRHAVVKARQVTESPCAIPTYASSCNDRDAYSSACSCFGVTETTTTVRPPRTTTTVTAVATDCPQRAIDAVPECAYDCFSQLYPSYNCTGLEDLECQCLNFEAIGTEVTPCVVEACTHAEVEAIFPAAQMGCDCFSAANPAPTAA